MTSPPSEQELEPVAESVRRDEDAPVTVGNGLQGALQEKVNEYTFLVAPVEQAIQEMQLVRGMLRARAEEEIHALSPPLAALSEVLGISTLDLLTATDRAAFLRDAVARARVPVEEIRQRVLEASADSQEELRALGLPESG
ncbi:MAG: hypothetical protein OHK0029_12660 [Armatimonadaceae bacterium]